MNNKEVYINDQLVDLDESRSPIRLTYAVNDLAELKDRQAYATNSFKLPLTQRNLDICGFPNDANIIGLQPYRRNTGKVVQGGIEVLVNGIAIITATSDNIQVQILSGLKGFFDTLADKKISDLDLSDYDHVWDIDTVADSQLNDEGFIYSVIDYGGLSLTERRADVRQLRPATFRKTIIERMVDEAGYTISGSYSSYQKYKDSLVAFSNDKFEHGPDYTENLETYKTSARNTNDIAFDFNIRDSVIALNDDFTTDPYSQWSGFGFSPAIVMRVDVNYDYSIKQKDIYFGGSAVQSYVQLQKFSGGVWTTFAQNITTQTIENYDFQFFYDQKINATIDLLPGESVRVLHTQHPAEDRMYAIILAGSQLTFTPIAQDVIYKSEVQLSATLPDISQKNFFKDFLQQFGLIVIPDNYNKSLLLINMEDVYNNKPIAEDITDKLYNSVDDITYSLGNYGVNNIAKYKEDDAVDTALGRGVMVLDNQTLENEVTIIESVFSASTTVNRMGGVSVAEIKKIEDIALSSEFKVKTQPRILLNEILNSSGFVFFDGSATRTVDQISVPKFDGLSYSLLLQENYEELNRMLYRPFVVSKPILLTEVDIANIDWRIPVYDKKTASYYYKNLITYQQGAVSTINLIRMG